MNITTIGRGHIGATLAQLWTGAGHDVTTLGRDGGDAGGADVVLLAVPSAAAQTALAGITGLQGKIVLDATNRLRGEAPPDGYPSVAEYVQATTNGPTAKAFNLNFGAVLDKAATASARPDNIWVGDEGARSTIEQLSRDIGMQARNAGPLSRSAVQEAFAEMLVAIVQDAGAGPLFYRFATPNNL